MNPLAHSRGAPCWKLRPRKAHREVGSCCLGKRRAGRGEFGSGSRLGCVSSKEATSLTGRRGERALGPALSPPPPVICCASGFSMGDRQPPSCGSAPLPCLRCSCIGGSLLLGLSSRGLLASRPALGSDQPWGAKSGGRKVWLKKTTPLALWPLDLGAGREPPPLEMAASLLLPGSVSHLPKTKEAWKWRPVLPHS